MNRQSRLMQVAALCSILGALSSTGLATTLVTLVATTLTATTATVTRLTTGSLTVSSTMTAAGYTATTSTSTYLYTATRLSNAGLLVFPPTAVGSGNTATTGVYGSTVIPVTATFQTVISSGLLSLMTSLPNISTSVVVGGSTLLPSGTVLILTSTQAVGGLILQDAGTLAGSQLQLGAATRQISQHKTLVLIWDATARFWKELAYGDL